MAVLERILYPSIKFASGVYVVAVVTIAILTRWMGAGHMGLLCAGLGSIVGWTAHVLIATARKHKPAKHYEFTSYEQNLANARKQLERVV